MFSLQELLGQEQGNEAVQEISNNVGADSSAVNSAYFEKSFAVCWPSCAGRAKNTSSGRIRSPGFSAFRAKTPRRKECSVLASSSEEGHRPAVRGQQQGGGHRARLLSAPVDFGRQLHSTLIPRGTRDTAR